MVFPGGADGKNPPANSGNIRDQFDPQVEKIPEKGS